MINEKLSSRLIDLRQSLPRIKGRVVSQEQVAKQAGIHPRSYWKAEKGHPVGDSILYKIAKFFNVSVDFLKTGKHIIEDNVTVTDRLKVRMHGPDGRLKDQSDTAQTGSTEQMYSGREQAGLKFKMSDAVAMAVEVLGSETGYSDALYLNIQHFARAIQVEARLSYMEKQDREQSDRIAKLEKECDDLKEEITGLKKKIEDLTIFLSPDESRQEGTGT